MLNIKHLSDDIKLLILRPKQRGDWEVALKFNVDKTKVTRIFKKFCETDNVKKHKKVADHIKIINGKIDI